MTGDWRDYRKAIWTAMLAIAIVAVLGTWLISAQLLGAAIGLAAAVPKKRRRAAQAERRR